MYILVGVHVATKMWVNVSIMMYGRYSYENFPLHSKYDGIVRPIYDL